MTDTSGVADSVNITVGNHGDNEKEEADGSTNKQVQGLIEHTMESVFSQKENYIVIGLTGKVGSGCTTVARVFQENFEDMGLRDISPNDDGLKNDREREDRIIRRFYRWHQKKFYVVSARDVIVSFVLENKESWQAFVDAWMRQLGILPKENGKLSKTDKLKRKSCLKGLVNSTLANLRERKDRGVVELDTVEPALSTMLDLIELDEDDNYDDLASGGGLIGRLINVNRVVMDCVEACDYDNRAMLASLDVPNFPTPASFLRLYLMHVLPAFSDAVRMCLAKHYTPVFQGFGNELRFCGTLDRKRRRQNLDVLLENAATSLGDAFRTRSESAYGASQQLGYPQAGISQDGSYMYTIAKRTNAFIKALQRKSLPAKDGSFVTTRCPIAVVVDSMKNIYESDYLKERYSAYYLVSVTRDEVSRVNGLLTMANKNLSRAEVQAMDFHERPGLYYKKLRVFARIIRENLKDLGVPKDGDDAKALRDTLDAIVDGNLGVLFDRVREDSARNWARPSSALGLDNGGEAANKVLTRLHGLGVSRELALYYTSLLDDPLRAFMYVSELYPFYLQDVEACIQGSDIFIANHAEVSDPMMRLRKQVIRYVALMMHPGLVCPTPVERCMQIATVAKVNSGCISRQVGAVVADSGYEILSIGWNDVPRGQTPCNLRNIVDLARKSDPGAYSRYEGESDGEVQQYLGDRVESGSDDLARILQGLPACYCFKDLHRLITGEKNVMESMAMHAEEKALLRCDQQRVKGGFLFTTSSPCIMCSKNAKEHGVRKIYYIEPYPGISQSHVCDSGTEDSRAQFVLYEGAIGRAYTQLYGSVLPYKDELSIRGVHRKLGIE